MFRADFHIPKNNQGAEVAYFCGNSLGLQPKKAAEFIQQELEDWQNLAVEGHVRAKRAWTPYHENFSEQLAKIVGAKTTEVVVMNTLTVNLHLLLVSFYRPLAKRVKIVIEKGAFPSDQYAVASHLKYRGFNPETALIEIAPRVGEQLIRTEDILTLIEAQGEEIAVFLMGGINYYTGQLFDMKTITAAAQEKGICVGWDLAHAAGNVPLELHDWNVDFAAWCNYKYLNGGVGAIGAAFINERYHNDSSLHRFAGWWGYRKADRFEMKSDFVPINTAEGWQLSNQPIFSLAPLLASLETFAQTNMQEIRTQSLQLTNYLQQQINGLNTDKISIISPSNPTERGAQLSIKIHNETIAPSNSKAVFQTLLLQGNIIDYRYPDVIRVAPAPLYNNFADINHFISDLKTVLSL
jgi:kynureninase